MKRFAFYALMGVAGSALGALVVSSVPTPEASRQAAWLGVALATASGALALLLKRWAMSFNGLGALNSGMKAFALAMASRVVLLTVGLWFVASRGEGALGFVAGFFGVYLVQQWLEISYLLNEQKRHSQLLKLETR